MQDNVLNEMVSIIVPVYNSENEIKKTLNSIINQTYPFLEIVLVDDGSTDNSLEVMKKFSEKDKRIKIITKTNGGVSSARNFGIKESKGKYIAFIDSDDYIDENYIELLYNKLKKTDSDIVRCMYKKNEKKISYFEKEKVFKLDNINERKEFGNEVIGTFKFNQVWAQLIKRDLIEGVFFDEELKMGEDYVFNYSIYRKAKKILVIPECLYHYSINENGMVHSIQADKIRRKIEDILLIYEKLYINQDGFLKRCVKEIIPHLLTALISTEFEEKEKVQIFNKTTNHQIIKSLIKKVNVKEFKNYKYKHVVKYIYTNNYKGAYIYANSVYKMIKCIKKLLGDKI